MYGLIRTKFSWYDVLVRQPSATAAWRWSARLSRLSAQVASTSFRTVAYGVKAAMLVNYYPSFGGVHLAFLNAGAPLWHQLVARPALTAGTLYRLWHQHSCLRNPHRHLVTRSAVGHAARLLQS